MATKRPVGLKDGRLTRLPPNPWGDGDALLVQNRLSELSASPADQEAAQANIGLGAIDPLAYYILAKS